MRSVTTILTVSLMILAAFWITSCTREKTVESTEYVHDIKYVDTPPDTIRLFDTIYRADSIQVHSHDTIHVVDTVRVTTTVHDTVRINSVIHDTIQTVKIHYDTLVVMDTVVKTQFAPNAPHAISAMEIQSDPLVLNYMSQQGVATDGWVFYLTPEQMAIKPVSTGVYDIDAYVTYYSSDFSSEYGLEVYWRMTYTSGDPSVSTNWTMADPPAATPGKVAGIRTVSKAEIERLTSRSILK